MIWPAGGCEFTVVFAIKDGFAQGLALGGEKIGAYARAFACGMTKRVQR